MTTHDQIRPTDVDPLVAATPARPGQRIRALAIDAVLPIAALTPAIVAFATGYTVVGWMLTLIVIGAAGFTIRALARTGRTLGRVAVGTRTVRRSTGAAAAASLLPSLLRGDLGTFDIRRGRDPFAPALTPLVFPERATVQASARGPLRGRAPVAELDSGQRLSIASALVLGRNPSAPTDAPADVCQWPDLSRSLSKSHARLEWDGRLVWVTDLGSTNGTFLRADGASQPLLPFQRTPIPAEATLELGDRVVTVTVGV
ncbi:MAG TPA: FHA domain-containing protein [Microbacterium sp.]|nr:FHA domain-containing protein [Microbacterium sp.]